MTLQQFLSHQVSDGKYHGPFQYPTTVPPVPGVDHATKANAPLPSAEPARMQPVSLLADSTFLSASSLSAHGQVASGLGVSPLHMRGSDGRLEISIAPGSFDLSGATVDGGAAPVSPLNVQIKQIHGHLIGPSSILGSYQIQVVDHLGRLVHGLRLTQPATIIYHYQPWEMSDLGIDPAHILLSWPDAIRQARQQKQPTAALVAPMTNDAQTQTLTAQVSTLAVVPFDVSGDPTDQTPPTPLMASVSGNSGQLSYTYPLAVVAGPAGFGPKLQMSYSSQATNQRFSRRSPANGMGDGWALSLGSISMATYPSTSTSGAGTWYFLNNVAGVSDRLVPTLTAGFYETEHISHLRIQFVNNVFHVWDRSGFYYEYGATADSSQYTTNSNGVKTTWRCDLTKVLAPYETTGQVKAMDISYLQDTTQSGGFTSVRDAGIKQIVYGYATTTGGTTLSMTAGTIDFHYHAPSAQGSWADAYGTNYHCSSAPPSSTMLRCDDPVTFGSVAAPAIMSTLTLDRITSYVGTDSSSANLAFRYDLSYQDVPFTTQYWDDFTQIQQAAAGEHLLTSIVPTVYQNGVAHVKKGLILAYTGPQEDRYQDTSQKIQNGTQTIQVGTFWQYLDRYQDLDTGVGATVSYLEAAGNTHGTPDTTDGNGNVIDDRLDPTYCAVHGCSGSYNPAEDHSWSLQVVTQMQALGTDSTDSIPLPTTTYHYSLATVGTDPSCNPITGSGVPPQEAQCVRDTWIPGYDGTQTRHPDGDWQDYYHGEFRGFNIVYTTNPEGDLTADYYYSTEAWYTPESDGPNYNAGALYQEDSYWGNQITDSLIQRRVQNWYPGVPGPGSTINSCNGQLNPTYNPCEIMVMRTKTTYTEGAGTDNANAPWVQHDYTYDDLGSGGLIFNTPVYHNLLQDVTSSSDGPTLTQKWTYQINDQTAGGITYYHVDEVNHSELDDDSGHVWQCQDITYDQGVASGVPTPAAGWITTATAHSDCTQPSTTALNTYFGHDIYGNTVASVDPFGTANSSLYGSSGCTLSTAPAYLPSAWTAGRFTSCSTFDSDGARPTGASNVLGQSSSTSYDYTQGALPISAVDLNGQTTTMSYSYDSNGNSTAQTKAPLETGSFTSQSSTNSTCTSSSNLPCYEVDTVSAQYPGAVSRTFYDQQGRVAETRTPLDSTHDLIVYIVHDETHRDWFQSLPFRVARDTVWLDPRTATDDTGATPGGTTTILDPLGRLVRVQDPLVESSAEPGILCSGWTVTLCYGYGFGQVAGPDNNWYHWTAVEDANSHMVVSFDDMLGRTRYVQWYSSPDSTDSNITAQKQIQYNALGEPTSVTMTDLTPQTGQTITSVTATATYDDLGRMISSTDPDTGNHSYTYDADGRTLTDVSGTRTLGMSYDLLGRVGCIQDAAPTTNGTGRCSSVSHPLMQYTYDTSVMGTAGSTDFPIGQMTKSIATTYYPDGTSTTTTQQSQHDQRGRLSSATLQLSVPGSWNATTALPTYQMNLAYNDANQLMTTQTTVGGQAGYTFSNAYDSTTGLLTGLSNNTTGVANLATLGYDAQGDVSDINFQTTTGTALANDHFTYDGDLRPATASATWQSGSGSSGTIFSQSRSYDPMGNVASISTTLSAVPGQSGSGGSDTQNFCYDEENRLVWAGNAGTQPAPGIGTCGSGTLSNSLSGAGYSSSYAYTHLGQLWQGPLNGTGSYQYLYCDNNHPHQLTGLYPLGTTCSNLSGAVYSSSDDAFGNVTSRTYNGSTATLSYDQLDQLVQWNAGANSQEWYAYDAGGNRTLRRSTTGSGTTITVYAFGLEEHVYSSSGSPQSSTYYYPLGGRLIGELQGSSTQFFLTDALGSIITTFNAVAGSAAVQGNQLYGPYGTSRYSQGSMGTNKGFTGHYADATGLDYYNARYYDPVIGRFLSADTEQGNGAGMDPYEYVGGNPETLTDPTGHRYIQTGGGGGGPTLPCGSLCDSLKNLPGGSGCGKYCPGNGTQVCDPQIGCHTKAVGQGTVYVKVEETHEVDVTTYSPVCYVVFCVSVPTVHKYFITTTHYVQVHVTFGVDVCLSGVVHGCGEEGSDDSDNTDDNHHTKPNVAASDDGAGDATGGGSQQGSSDTKTVTYSRVQGGTPPNASRFRIFVNEDGSISIPNKSADLNVSVGTEHADYFRGIRGGGSEIVQFDIPKWLDEFIAESAVEQYGYRRNPLNQGGTVPKLVDPTTPGVSYELPSPWIRWLEEYATNGRVS